MQAEGHDWYNKVYEDKSELWNFGEKMKLEF